MVVVRVIELASHCEHHMVSFVGLAHVAYLPDWRVVGLSKLALVVDIFARRLQVQEKLTVRIAEVIDRVLQPRGASPSSSRCATTAWPRAAYTSPVRGRSQAA